MRELEPVFFPTRNSLHQNAVSQALAPVATTAKQFLCLTDSIQNSSISGVPSIIDSTRASSLRQNAAGGVGRHASDRPTQQQRGNFCSIQGRKEGRKEGKDGEQAAGSKQRERSWKSPAQFLNAHCPCPTEWRRQRRPSWVAYLLSSCPSFWNVPEFNPV